MTQQKLSVIYTLYQTSKKGRNTGNKKCDQCRTREQQWREEELNDHLSLRHRFKDLISRIKMSEND